MNVQPNKELIKFVYPLISLNNFFDEQVMADITCTLVRRQGSDKPKKIAYDLIMVATVDNGTKDALVFNGMSKIVFGFYEKSELNVNDTKLFIHLRERLVHMLKLNFNIETRGLNRPTVIIAEYVLQDVTVNTNVGTQVTSLQCVVQKRFVDKDDITLVEKLFYKKPDHWYSVDIIPIDPIREYRDKDYLNDYKEDGSNDATYRFGASIPHERGEVPDTSIDAVRSIVMDRLKGFDPEVKRAETKERNAKKKPWTNRMLFSKNFENRRIGAFTSIHPFFGDHLSGWTDILSLALVSDDEHGYGFQISILGVQLYYNDSWITKKIQDAFAKNKPKWVRGNSWGEFYPLLRKWEKEYPIECFLMSEWEGKLGLSRARGLYWSREFNQGAKSKWGWKLNPWRNKFWNLI
jgi:hypothetical protein